MHRARWRRFLPFGRRARLAKVCWQSACWWDHWILRLQEPLPNAGRSRLPQGRFASRKSGQEPSSCGILAEAMPGGPQSKNASDQSFRKIQKHKLSNATGMEYHLPRSEPSDDTSLEPTGDNRWAGRPRQPHFSCLATGWIGAGYPARPQPSGKQLRTWPPDVRREQAPAAGEFQSAESHSTSVTKTQVLVSRHLADAAAASPFLNALPKGLWSLGWECSRNFLPCVRCWDHTTGQRPLASPSPWRVELGRG